MNKPCLIKKVYEKYTPHVQIFGWCVIIGAVSYSANAGMAVAASFDARISANSYEIRQSREADIQLREQFNAMNQKLDLAISLLRKGR